MSSSVPLWKFKRTGLSTKGDIVGLDLLQIEEGQRKLKLEIFHLNDAISTFSSVFFSAASGKWDEYKKEKFHPSIHAFI